MKATVFNLINPSQQAEVEFLVDSGAIYTVIPATSLQSLEITAHSERTFTLADGRQITWPVGNAGFTIGSRQGASVVVFGPDDTPALLGVATLEELGLGLDPVRRELIQIRLPLFSGRGEVATRTMSRLLTTIEGVPMAHKKLLDPIHPGEILREEFMRPLGISINRLAREIAVPPGRVSAIVNGKRAITADTALRLAKYCGVSSELWLGLQADFDLRIARRRIGPEIEKRVHAHVA